MKPFLLLQHRYLNEAADNEYEAVLRYGMLRPEEVHRIRMEQTPVGTINLHDYSGIILGGGPANVSDPSASKNSEQLRFEKELLDLYNDIFEFDFPFLGMCYGMGSLAAYLNGRVSKERYSESAGAVTVKLNTGVYDPILEHVPESFRALAGHKEAVQELPDGCVLLAGNEICPVQMIRCKKNIYATQFHPELDYEGITFRLKVYKNQGYFNPDEVEDLFESLKGEEIIYPQQILQNFVQLHRK